MNAPRSEATEASITDLAGRARALRATTLHELFARDPARTPVLIRTPLPLGTFSLELAR